MRRIGFSLAFGAAVLLASCGGDTGQRLPEAGGTAARIAAQTEPDDGLAIQRLYVAYLGRPADAAGLAFHRAAQRGAATPTAPAMLATYAHDRVFAASADGFAASAEAQQLHLGDNATYLTALYRQLFNRDPDPGGATYWAGALERLHVNRATLPLALLAGAHGDDLQVFERKAVLAAALTAAAGASYDGPRGAVAARLLLDRAGPAMDEQASADAVRETVSAMTTGVPVSAAQAHAVIVRRCVGCHSVTPALPGFATAPRGIRFDTVEQVKADARRIHINVVVTAFMPYGNRTHMTPAERQLIDVWFTSGAN